MIDIRTKVKRQTEILGLVIANPGKFQILDFEVIYNVNKLTIKRDLRELRAIGIDIHSVSRQGIQLFSKIDPELINKILTQYVGFAVNFNSFDQASRLLIRKLHHNAIAFMAALQISIENSNLVRILYQKPEEKTIDERIVEPYCIFQSEKNWRLLANHNKVIKQFLIGHIKSLEILDKRFKPISKKELDGIFCTSFRSWIGNERYDIRLKLSPVWAKRIKPRQLMESQKVTELEDGSIIYETTVNSLEEVASWVVSRGKGVIVLEPEKLKRLVIDLAEGVLKNYS